MVEAARSIFREQFCWFGSPPLLHKPAEQFNFDPLCMSDELPQIIDGSVRFQALVGLRLPDIWRKAPALVYHGESLHSSEGRKLLPRMLTLAGHYDRAARHIPEPWRSTVDDVANYLNVSNFEALEVMVILRGIRQKELTIGQVRQRSWLRHENVIRSIRRGLQARALEGEPFGLSEIARLVGYDGPIT